MKKNRLILIALNTTLIALVIFFLSISRSDMIIYLGVSAADILTIVFWSVIAAVFILGNGILILRILKEKHSNSAVDVLVAQIDEKVRLSPEEIRSEIKNYTSLYPNLTNFTNALWSQMDSIDRKQENLKQIFRKNSVNNLDTVDAAVDQAEQNICRNAVKILNRITIWDPLEVNKSGKEEIYAQHRAYISKYIDSNEDILSKCDILLSETVDYINEKDSTGEAGNLHLDIMTETVQALKAMNHGTL